MAAQPKQRGRPVGNKELRVLRSRTWYLNLKSKEDLSDCRLDVMFGTGPDETLRSTADRIKVFEAIRVNGSIPASGTSNKRGFDLVAHVDKDKKYRGTAAIINSPFWRLMEYREISLKEIRELIIDCVSRLELATRPGDCEDDGIDYSTELAKNPELSSEEYLYFKQMGDDAYDNAMAEAFWTLAPSLDYAALLFALFLEAIEAGNLQIAYDQIRNFKNIIEQFCNQEWLKKYYTGVKLYEYAEIRIQAALNADALKGLPGYADMLYGITNVNLRSPVAAFLLRHQRTLWRREVTPGSHIPRHRPNQKLDDDPELNLADGL